MASFLDLFGVVDSDGVSPARYRLHFIGSSFSNQDSWIFGMLTELVYVLFQAMVIPANALLGTVIDSGAWLDPLAGFYQRATAPLFAVFPPWAIACFGMGLVAVSVLMSRPDATSLKVGSDHLNRIGGALAMVVMVLVLTSNPFALVAKLLELANGFAGGLAAQVTGASADSGITAGQTLVDASIRTPTIALNYGRTLDGRCLQQWSESMVTGEGFQGTGTNGFGCLNPGDDVASPSSLATALMMLLLPALPMLAFCVVAAWKYLVHLTMSVLSLLATGWVAAVSVHRRRGFERLAQTFGHCVAHLAMAVINSMIAVALPTACAGVGVQLLGVISSEQTQAYALMVSLGVGFAVSTWAILKVTSNHGVLARALHADANNNLEKMFGLTPNKYAFGFSNVTSMLGIGGAPAANGPGGKTPPGVKKSALLADPVAATAAKGPRPGAGAKPANPNAAVAQLITAAQSMAGSPPPTPNTGAPTAGGTRTAAATARPVTAPSAAAASVLPTLVTAAGTAAVVSLTTKAATTSPGTAAAPNSPPPSVDTFGFYFPTSGEDVTPAGAATPAPDGETASAAAVPASPLADAPRATLPSDPSGAPVSGLRGADPSLEAVAQLTGVTFVPADSPKPERRVSALLRRFRPGPPIPAPPGAVPEVVYAPPLGADVPAAADTGLVGKAKKAVKSAGVNVQQVWNRRTHLSREAPPSESEPDDHLPDGEVPTKPNPGSFIAPKPDFLAGDDLEAQIEQVKLIAAAAGQPITIEIDPNDTRIGLELSSDPDERIRPSNPPGFGDPI